MISGLERALTTIAHSIPNDILIRAFDDFEYNTSVDAQILEKVIIPRVKNDVSLRGGRVLKICLDPSWCMYTTIPGPMVAGLAGSRSVFKIPPEAREGRDIVTVMAVRYPYGQMASSRNPAMLAANANMGNSAKQIANHALAQQTGAYVTITPTAVIRPGNVVQLNPPQAAFIPWVLETRVAYDDEFSGMDVSEIETFEQLCLAATKAYCYNTLRTRIGTNEIYRGMAVGIIKDMIEEYRDANEKYTELLLQMGGASHLSMERLPGLLRRMVPGR